jgi:hypothetical protein
MARPLRLKTELGEDIGAGGMGKRGGNNSWGKEKFQWFEDSNLLTGKMSERFNRFN